MNQPRPTQLYNYRPIALTCAICKILEYLISIFCHSGLSYLPTLNLINKHQPGILAWIHQTPTNLLESHAWLHGQFHLPVAAKLILLILISRVHSIPFLILNKLLNSFLVSAVWQLSISYSKCLILHVGSKSNHTQSYLKPSYQVGGLCEGPRDLVWTWPEIHPPH